MTENKTVEEKSLSPHKGVIDEWVMKCLRCGHCCKNYVVIVVNDPKIGLKEDNLITQWGDGTPCKHLLGNDPGEYSCAIHDEDWYEETPCFAHRQLEFSLDAPCRIGEYIMLRNKGTNRE